MLYFFYSLIWCVTTVIYIHCQYPPTFSVTCLLRSHFALWLTCKYNLKQILLVKANFSHVTGLNQSSNIFFELTTIKRCTNIWYIFTIICPTKTRLNTYPYQKGHKIYKTSRDFHAHHYLILSLYLWWPEVEKQRLKK